MEITCNRTTVALEPYTAREVRTFQRGQRVIVKGLVRKAEMSDIEVDGWDGYLVVQLNRDGADFAVKADCFTGGNAALKTLKEAEYDMNETMIDDGECYCEFGHFEPFVGSDDMDGCDPVSWAEWQDHLADRDEEDSERLAAALS